MVNRVLHLGTSWGNVGSAGQFDPSKKSSHLTLSGSNLVATSGSGATSATNVFSFTGHSTGKWYAEFTLTAAVGSAGSQGVGIGNSSAAPDNGHYLGSSSSESFGRWSDGFLFRDPASPVSGLPTFTTGDRVDIAVDLANHEVYFRVNNGNWNNNPSADPATPTGGISFSSLGGSEIYYLAAEGETSGDVWTANFAGSFSGTAPSGYSAWG